MIANTILQQLGSHGFTVMTGSRNYINLSHGLQMSLARNKTCRAPCVEAERRRLFL